MGRISWSLSKKSWQYCMRIHVRSSSRELAESSRSSPCVLGFRTAFPRPPSEWRERSHPVAKQPKSSGIPRTNLLSQTNLNFINMLTEDGRRKTEDGRQTSLQRVSSAAKDDQIYNLSVYRRCEMIVHVSILAIARFNVAWVLLEWVTFANAFVQPRSSAKATVWLFKARCLPARKYSTILWKGILG